MSFDPIKLKIRLGEKTIGSVSVDGDRDETDFYSVVSIEDLMTERRIYGIDPISAFGEGLRLVEKLTEEVRFTEDLDPHDLKIVVS